MSVVKVSQAWKDAPYELCETEASSTVLLNPTRWRFTKATLTSAIAALKTRDFAALEKLSVPPFEYGRR